MDSLGDLGSTSAQSDEPSLSDVRERSTPDRARQRKQTKPKSYQQKQRKILKEILFYQKNTKLLVAKAPMSRIIREITYSYSNTVTRYTISALEALHEAVEMYIVQFLQDAYLLALHRGRVTLMLQDMQLLQILKPL